jgi:hypothetical protein
LFLLEGNMKEAIQKTPQGGPATADVEEVDAVLLEFDGDARAAIAALLHDLRTLAIDVAAATSRGYVRGNVVKLPVRRGLPQG